MARLKMETSVVTTTVSNTGALTSNAGTTAVVTSGNVAGVTSLSLGQMDCYEDMFKEITKKLYGEEGLAEVIDATGVTHSNLLYDPDAFRTDAAASITAGAGAGLTLVTSAGNGLPPGAIVVQRRLHEDKGESVALSAQTQHQVPSVEERWFDSEEILSWTTSKIARYNPAQKVFRCVDCDFVGFLSRVAEHWLGNHASLRVFQCPRCPYTSAWARCVRMHLTRQHGETLTDNSLWKENPVLEEVTKFLNTLKTKVEQKGEASDPGAKRYACPYCPYATDRRDLFNRHENIHRDEKPFQCYVCEKQFNRADHVKKHFMRMHRDHNYDINRIRKNIPKSHGGAVPFFSNRLNNNKPQQPSAENIICDQEPSTASSESVALHLQSGNNEAVSMQQIPHIAYFSPPITPGQTGPLQGIPGVGGIKKEVKTKGTKKKKCGEKMYTCSYCPWQGVDNWCLKRHLNTHIKPFLCALCDYKAARSERLATHVLKVHNKRVCHKCSFLADDLESLNQHIQDSHQNPLVKTGFNCNICQEYFELRADLEAHAILEHQKVIVQCDLCDFRTTDEMSMESHLREKHNLQPGMGAVAAAAAAAAAAAGTPQPQLQLAPQPVIQLQALHEQVPVVEQHQADPALIVPDQMDASIIDEVTFNEESPIQKMDQTVPDGVVVPEIEPETFCESCGYEFVNEESFKLHEKLHEMRNLKSNFDMKTSKNISRSYGCRTCSYTSCTKNNMLQHLRAHTGFLMECRAPGCQFASPFENSLKEHVQLEHNDDNSRTNVRCPHCGIKLSSIRGFTLHWRFHHGTLCSLCVNVYKIKYGMKEAGIHDLVLKNPLNILNDGLSNSEESEKTQGSTEQICSTGEASEVAESRQKLSQAFTKKINDTLCEAINGVNMGNNSRKYLGRNKTGDSDESSEPSCKKMRLINHILPSISAVVLNGNIVSRYALRFLPKLIELLVVPLHRSDRQQEKMWRYLCRHSVIKYPYTCYKEPHVVPKHVFNYLIISKSMLINHGVKCHKLKCRCRRFQRKSTYHIHCLWNHSTKRFKCDNCDEKFRHFYQAFLHKLRAHSSHSPDSHQQPENSIHLQIRQHSFAQHINQTSE